MKLIKGASVLVVALGLFPLQVQKNAREPGWSESQGMLLPRPVGSEQRQALGFPSPREAKVLLAELDVLEGKMAPITETDDAWKRRQREYFAMQRQRINCISELEETGYV